MMFSYYNVGTKTTSYMIDHWPFLAIEKLTLLCYIKRHQDTEDWRNDYYQAIISSVHKPPHDKKQHEKFLAE